MESCGHSDQEIIYTNSSSPSSSGSDHNNSTATTTTTSYGINNFIHAPFTAFLEYSGILPGTSSSSSSSTSQETDQFIPPTHSNSTVDHQQQQQQVTISIIDSNTDPNLEAEPILPFAQSPPAGVVEVDNVASADASSSSSSSSYQRYDIQNFARWIEHVLPFSLLLLLVFIRQHFQGFCITLWIAAVLFKSNDIMRKQTALKGERKKFVLIGLIVLFMLHVMSIYWWYRNDDLLFPLVLLPPNTTPPFWHAIFIIVVNDAMVRQVAMVFKCMLLIYYKNSRGHNYPEQGQMLTLVEYLLLLYRALLPTPVWYRFFLNKEYGSLFSSLITGLYLTFKLTSIVGKAQLFFSALRASSRKGMHYGSYATSEQVNAVGDLCAICQEKMHAPILLRCKHIFCEDCVSEWFERERTCPLCRALVKPADIRSYSDGSTSLFFQIF